MAVSRCHQIRRFFVAGDEPNYPDNDFPLKNNKIIPSGYLCLIRKASRCRPHLPPYSRLRSFSVPATERRQFTNQVPPMRSLFPVGKAQENIGGANWRPTRDKLGRLHYAWPCTGPLHIYLRSSKFYSSSITHHCADVEPLIKEKQKSWANSAVLIVDGGPDWSAKSTTTLMALGRLWRDNQLDHLVAVSYQAPYQRRFNPIEHAWSPRSNDLTGLRLSATLDGETVPVSTQSGLSDDDALGKEAAVHDLAITTVSSHWAGKKYDGDDDPAQVWGFLHAVTRQQQSWSLQSYQEMSLHLLALDEKPAAPDQFIAQDGKAPDSCSKCRYIYRSAADSGRNQRLAHGGAASKAPADSS